MADSSPLLPALKVVAWSKVRKEHMPRMRMLSEGHVNGVWDVALCRLSEAEEALQQAALQYVSLFGELQRSIEENEVLRAEIAALREDARWLELTEEQCIDLFAAALYISARGDETSVLSEENANRIVELLCDLSGVDLDAAIAKGEAP